MALWVPELLCQRIWPLPVAIRRWEPAKVYFKQERDPISAIVREADEGCRVLSIGKGHHGTDVSVSMATRQLPQNLAA